MPAYIYAHMTWVTRDRTPLITEPVAAFLQRFLRAQAARLDASVVALAVTPDHVHALLSLPAGCDVPRLAQFLKGASARVANRDGVARPETPLRWARGYDFRSVSPTGIPAVRRYLDGQPGRIASES